MWIEAIGLIDTALGGKALFQMVGCRGQWKPPCELRARLAKGSWRVPGSAGL